MGPNGVFVVENKDYRGLCEGNETDYHWVIHKIGCRGTRYRTLARNPVRQVKHYVSLLGNIFRERGIRAWITPMVSLSRDNNLAWVVSEKVQVVPASTLYTTVIRHCGVIDEGNRRKILDVLDELRAKRADPQPQTIAYTTSMHPQLRT